MDGFSSTSRTTDAAYVIEGLAAAAAELRGSPTRRAAAAKLAEARRTRALIQDELVPVLRRDAADNRSAPSAAVLALQRRLDEAELAVAKARVERAEAAMSDAATAAFRDRSKTLCVLAAAELEQHLDAAQALVDALLGANVAAQAQLAEAPELVKHAGALNAALTAFRRALNGRG